VDAAAERVDERTRVAVVVADREQDPLGRLAERRDRATPPGGSIGSISARAGET
jgi:hypothetical protein